MVQHSDLQRQTGRAPGKNKHRKLTRLTTVKISDIYVVGFAEVGIAVLRR
jgi:hypothetical protein